MIGSDSKSKKKLRPDFKKLFKTPPMLVSREFSVWVGNNYVNGLARFGVIALKKHIKQSVARNKSKRIAKQAFDKYRPLFVNRDLVLVIKQFEINANYIYKWRKKLIEVYAWVGHFWSKR